MKGPKVWGRGIADIGHEVMLRTRGYDTAWLTLPGHWAHAFAAVNK
ncbi:MAG TPA: hypothetical protein VM124_00755 [Candidatus Limnocylindrales bacterium]|nr:hypothetical protein [Candidatus Limnocylindrales bacterium]